MGRHVPLRYEARCRLQKEKLDAAVRELVLVCGKVGGILEIYAFGSYARDSVAAESDLDALIIRETEERRVRREDDIRALLRAPVDFDLLVITPYERIHVLPQNPMGRHILAEARLLHRYPHQEGQ